MRISRLPAASARCEGCPKVGEKAMNLRPVVVFSIEARAMSLCSLRRPIESLLRLDRRH